MYKILRDIGLLLLIPGLVALGFALFNGPEAWATDIQTFWGTPISLFVFWIGLAHAGTLISAVFLVLDVKMDRRTAMLAELSTLCSLAVAVVFPLMHLGIVDRFYMAIPLADARMNFANIRSPLVWDFCCIFVYGVLSLLFFMTHLSVKRFPGLDKIRKPLGWLLFPLVLWVHTVVSLDFATTFVPEWRGAFFPVYFIIGAIYSGLALVCAILWFEGYRMRLLEQLLKIGSWLLCAIWLWNYMVNGTFCASAFVFAGVLPQLLLVSAIRNSRVCRLLIYISILFGLLLERLFLVSPGLGSSTPFGWVDLGLISFGLGFFILAFCGIRWYLGSAMEGEGTFFGEVDSDDLQNEEPEKGESPDVAEPWKSMETRALRFPLFVGLSLAVLFCVWSASHMGFDNVDLSAAQMIPVVYPLTALVASLIIYGKAFFQDVNPLLKKENPRVHSFVCILALVGLVLLAGLFGVFYGGGQSESSREPVSSLSREHAPMAAPLIWNSRCATCHGRDGKFNEKFVREFYPVPQKLDMARLDSIGTDSLVQVILKGRTNMNPYGGRLTEEEARGLVLYMRKLAGEEQ